MRKVSPVLYLPVFLCAFVFFSCSQEDNSIVDPVEPDNPVPETGTSAIERVFGDNIDLDNLYNYASPSIPGYIDKDNSAGREISDEGATLGRILFYDKQLSVNNTISCASCHQQSMAFGDPEQLSTGVNGMTGRHSMRLINSRYADETEFFWDERANSLEDQTTQPIQDHIEMGFSGQNGDPDLNALIVKLEELDYYQELFTFVYGDANITEARMQSAMAQFIRSIHSFDSRYDLGRRQVNGNNQNFPNFTEEENQGKRLFMTAPGNGGAGCNGCHRAPEFDIDPNSDNNGVTTVANMMQNMDFTVSRAPSLRDLTKTDGSLNGPMMHDGSFTTLRQVIDHYNDIMITPGNNNLDRRLRGGGPGMGPNGNGQSLQLSEVEKNALESFLRTLSGSMVYTDPKWSDPFE